MSNIGSMDHKAVMLCLALCVGWTACAGELVITREGIPFEVGYRAHYAVTVADGDGPSEIDVIVIGKRTVGPRTLLRIALPMGPMRLADQWIAIGETELAIYASFDDPLPVFKYPLPLKKGLTFEYQSTRGKVQARVEGPVTVATPGGKFACLLIVEDRQDGAERWQQKLWVAPGVGHVKQLSRVGKDFTSTLVSHEKPREVKAQPGAHVVSTFDVGNPIGSPLFPRAIWAAGTGKLQCSSVADIDPTGGAAGTPFCLRWTYHALGTWANVVLIPSGVWDVTTDLSRYGSISFHIKGMTPGQCSLLIAARPKAGEGRRFVGIPFRYSTKWQKVTLPLQAHPRLAEVDLKQVLYLGFAADTGDEAAGVISIDEIMLHTGEGVGEF